MRVLSAPSLARSAVVGGRRRPSTVARANVVPVVAGDATTKVVFKCQQHVEFGQQLRLVGCDEALGAWDIQEAPVMVWSEGDNWSVELELPQGEVEFKLALLNEDGSSTWEDGNNRVLTVEPAPEADAFQEAVCAWWDTTSTSSMMSVDEEDFEGVDVPKAEGEEGKKAWWNVFGDDESEKETETVGKMEMEKAPEPTPEPKVDTVGKMEMETPTASEAVPEAAPATTIPEATSTTEFVPRSETDEEYEVKSGGATDDAFALSLGLAIAVLALVVEFWPTIVKGIDTIKN